MGQDGPTENVIPRVQALRNTQFLKGGSRLVVSLVGVWAPGLWANPIMYTVLEDQIHGANMIAALLVDMLLESVQRQNCLPRRMFIHADNTAKETKNTIVLYAAIWMLVQMQRTRLQSIEFGYLLVGHTHDLIDAMFAWVGKALVGLDVISLPEMFQALQTRMKKHPCGNTSVIFTISRAANRAQSALEKSKTLQVPIMFESSGVAMRPYVFSPNAG